MKAHYTPLSKQHGIVIPLVAIAMLALLGVTGLALDMGHLYVNKTRLQNAVDAAALSGAMRLDETRGDQSAATAAALANYGKNKSKNPELSNAPAPDITFFELAPGACGGLGYTDCFIRVTVTRFDLASWFIQVLGIDTTTVAARAVAGPSTPLAEACKLLPITLCGTPDDDCSDGECYGYSLGAEVVLKAGTSTDVGPGNFNFIRLECPGADCVSEALAGGQACTGDTVTTQPGNAVAAAKGLNTRLGIYDPPFQPADATIYPPDLVTDAGAPGYRDTHSDYTSGYPSKTDPAQPGYHRREAPVVFADCSMPEDSTGGTTTFPILGYGCFFIDRPADTGPNEKDFCGSPADPPPNSKREICGEFFQKCNATGVPGAGGNFGPYTIQLYKDPTSGDS